MPFIKKTYNEITNDLISHITKGIAREHHEYEAGKVSYRLKYGKVLDILKVEGSKGGASTIFQKSLDYQLSGNKIEWLSDGEKPDENTLFFVNYRLDAPTEITDTNPGSVVRTLIESIALEIDLLYAKLNEVYDAGFIDTASGRSLDLVVSLLGMMRKPAGAAQGFVTFGRNNEPEKVRILHESHEFTGVQPYPLHKTQVIEVSSVEGEVNRVSVIFKPEEDYRVDANIIQWVDDGHSPDPGSSFHVDYQVYEEYQIPVDTRVSTYSKRSSNSKIFRTLKESWLTRNRDGQWCVDVPVVSLREGKEGNVYAGSITVMPSPPVGIEYVINKSDILNGTDPESDADLRERAKHALEMAGKATLVSLKSAVQSVDGITGDVKVVDQPDGVPGIVQIIASGGDEQEINEVIENTRSAGILVEFKRPQLVPLLVSCKIFVTQGLVPDDVRLAVDRSIRNYFSSLVIDEDVILSRIIAAALAIPGVRDIHDVTINGQSENIMLKYDQKGELRSLDVFLGDETEWR